MLRPDATPRTAESFIEAQALGSRRLGFTVTKACPLRCGHCSVKAMPNLGHTTFREDFAHRVIGQLPALRESDVRFIDFTGGEPTLAAAFVRMVSAAAKQHGILCGVVTAAHWAKDGAQAKKFLDKFRDIDYWDISTDTYHLPFVPLHAVERAYSMLLEQNKTPLIRIAYNESMPHEDAVLIDRVMQFAGKRIHFQPVAPIGRAADFIPVQPVTEDAWDRSACPSTGPLVLTTGIVAPCCAPLSTEEFDHPLLLGNAFMEDLVAIVRRWRVHPLLQTMRLWGVEPIVRWLEEAGAADYVHMLRSRVCHECVELVGDRTLCAIAMERANTMPHRIKVAYALREYFDEPWMDEQLQLEAQTILARVEAS